MPSGPGCPRATDRCQDVLNEGSDVAETPNDDDPYDEARHDAAFLRAVTTAHTGSWPVLDALWWWSHPEEPSPQGTPAPTGRLRDLQRRVFAADGDATDDPDVAGALLALQAEIAAERAAVVAAVVVARTGQHVPAATGAQVAGAGADPVAAVPGEPAEPLRAPLRRRASLVVALAGAVAFGVVVGAQVDGPALWGAGFAPESGAPAATTMDTATPLPAVEVPVLAAQVFARTQAARDIPLVPMPAAFDPGSFRYLGSAGWTDADGDGMTDSPYYAARGTEDLICLVAVPEGSGYLSTCALESGFPAVGLRLSWQSTDMLQGASTDTDTGAKPMVLDITVAWQRDSTIETRGSGRVVAP